MALNLSLPSCLDGPDLVSQLSQRLHQVCKKYPKVALQPSPRVKWQLTVNCGLLDGSSFISSELYPTYLMACRNTSVLLRMLTESHNGNVLTSLRISLSPITKHS